jgi:hypothetical protein
MKTISTYSFLKRLTISGIFCCRHDIILISRIPLVQTFNIGIFLLMNSNIHKSPRLRLVLLFNWSFDLIYGCFRSLAKTFPIKKFCTWDIICEYFPKTNSKVTEIVICSLPPWKVSLYSQLPVGKGFSFVHFTFAHRFSLTVSLVKIHRY